MSASELRYFLLGLLLLAGARVHAQAGPAITEADIERARRLQPLISEQDVEATRRRQSDANARTSGVPPRATPDIEALPRSPADRRIDLESVAKSYDEVLRAQTSVPSGGPSLLVFVSFSIPQATLTRLVDQASRAGATLVIRGLVGGSLQQTVARVRGLVGARRVAFQIDPQSFDRFAVTRTPTFVLVRQVAQPVDCDTAACYAPDAYASASGDVSLDYALEFIARGAPRFAADAQPFLARLGK